MVCHAETGKINGRFTLNTDTIAAQATPSGRGGIAVVRVSGPKVRHIIQEILKTTLLPRQAAHLPFYDDTQEVIDEGIAIFFPHPHSFTGEDVLELQGHGGSVIVDLLLKRLIHLGARLARPGEFSERAFLNNKMDLTQAEAIADLIDAVSHQAARSAMRSLQGEFSREINSLNEKIIHLRMYIEAAIDFTDEEIDFLSDNKIIHALENIIDVLHLIQQKAVQGSLLREGITAVIAGEPNVGKSSLLNCLSGKDLAIVTDIPGTTRDILRDHIQIDGMPMHVIDTAGLRDSEDIIEQEGIKRAHQEIIKADMILYVTSAAQENLTLSQPLRDAHFSQPVIYVRNKIDLTLEQPRIEIKNKKIIVSLSAKENSGMDLLKDQIKSLAGFHTSGEGVYFARRRHLDALARALSHVNDSLQQLKQTGSGELAAEDLRQAHLALCEITGSFTTQDLLGRIFSSFCIGK